jgi:hypothetical protein
MPFYNTSELTPTFLNRLCFIFTSCLLLAACAGVKNPPQGRPFVYSNTVKLTAPNLSKEALKIQQGNLLKYLDDSLVVPTRSVLGFTQRLRPPVFDSNHIYTSIRFMEGYLKSEGYYRSRVDTFTVDIDTATRKKKQQYRVNNTFYVTAGKVLRVDTVEYAFQNPELQMLAFTSKPAAVVKKGGIYTQQTVGQDLDRLASIYRQNGFLRITKNVLLGEVDTTDQSLISFDTDPVEVQLLAQRRLDSPTVKIKLMQRPGVGESYFKKYLIDSVVFYPETNVRDNVDSLIRDTTFKVFDTGREIFINQKFGLFENRLIRRGNYLLPGRVYNEKNYFRTLNGFAQMGPWQQADIRTFLHHTDSLSKVSFHFFLYPAKRQSFQIDLEGSQNNSVSGSLLTGQFFALSLIGTHRHKNILRRGTQSTTTGRIGFELNNAKSSGQPGLFQSFITGVNQSFSIPRLIWPFRYADTRQLDNRRTIINFGAYYADRFEFFEQISFSGNITWEARLGKNNLSLSFPVFESVQINETDSLIKVIQENPSLLYSFTPGNILSTRARFERGLAYPKHPRNSGLLRTSAEITVPGSYELFNEKFFQFLRTEMQFIHQYTMAKSSLHMRLLGAVGWNTGAPKEATLPFFRQFVSGGNMNMRAWGLRQLGLGNSLAADTAGYTDRFGDIQLELNFEHRFKIARLLGYNINGAFFIDIGNIWNHYPASDGLGDLRFKTLYRDLAMGIGTGIRWDFSYLVIRLDRGFKLKDPVRKGDGWLKEWEWSSKNRLGTNERSNVALQFGIGYPF